MSKAVPVLLARMLLPLATIAFGVSFYLSIQDMSRSEKLFPIVLIVPMLLMAVGIVGREIYRFAVLVGRASRPAALDSLDADGLRTVGWQRSVLIAGAGVLYLVAIEPLGLMVTGFLVYTVCAAALIPDKSVPKHWIYALIGAVVASVAFDSVFRLWLELPLPGL